MADAFLDAAQICAATFVRHAEIRDELGSTNDRAAELASSSQLQLPALIVARQQTAGRGRGEHSWWSTDGALTFSVLLEPESHRINPAAWPQLSLTTAVALCDALGSEIGQRTGAGASPQLAIKWPNDVFVDSAKIAGILIESPGGATPAKDRLIIGVGINVNNSWQSAPRGVNANGTALCDATRHQHDLQQVLVLVLQSLQKRIAQLAENDPALPAAWQRLSWLSNRNVVVDAGTTSTTGICLGIDTDGALLVHDSLKTHRIFSGTVRAV